MQGARPAGHQPRGAHRLAVARHREGQLAPGTGGELVDLQPAGDHDEHPLGVLSGANDPLFAPPEA